MKTIYLTLVSLLLSTFVIGQNETITGKITDEFNNGLERSWVLVIDADDYRYKTGTITDENGNFEIDLKVQGTFLLTADHFSFETPRVIGMLNNKPSYENLEIINQKQLEKIATLDTSSIPGIYSENEISTR